MDCNCMLPGDKDRELLDMATFQHTLKKEKDKRNAMAMKVRIFLLGVQLGVWALRIFLLGMRRSSCPSLSRTPRAAWASA